MGSKNFVSDLIRHFNRYAAKAKVQTIIFRAKRPREHSLSAHCKTRHDKRVHFLREERCFWILLLGDRLNGFEEWRKRGNRKVWWLTTIRRWLKNNHLSSSRTKLSFTTMKSGKLETDGKQLTSIKSQLKRTTIDT